MIDGGTTCLRLLRRQERAQPLPMLVSEPGNPQQAQGRWWVCRHCGCLACVAQPMEVLRTALVPTPKARPVQAAGLLVLRLAHRLEQATHLWYAQFDPLVSASAFFS
jgi:hypothetical protein